MQADESAVLRENIARLRANVAAACARAGRDAADVRLVAVTKYAGPAYVQALVDAGVADLGESRVQQLVARARTAATPCFDWPESATDAPAAPRWHMIGHLQRNKVRLLLPHARIIHSLDSVRLGEELQRQAASLGVSVDVFIEVNLAGEQSKTGLSPGELTGVADAALHGPNLRLRGLMTMAPYNPDPECSRPYFARLRAMLSALQDAGRVPASCRHLSMGMSQDYAVAVEEGATFIRVGSALFEGLPTSDPR